MVSRANFQCFNHEFSITLDLEYFCFPIPSYPNDMIDAVYSLLSPYHSSPIHLAFALCPLFIHRCFERFLRTRSPAAQWRSKRVYVGPFVHGRVERALFPDVLN